MTARVWRQAAAAACALFILRPLSSFGAEPESSLNDDLRKALVRSGFTGTVESTLEQRLGRPIDRNLADLGRLLWFDKAGGLHSDNTCGGCHSPANGFGDSQSIAIGVQNNNLVGPNRTGPRNQRRTPTAANAAFYPNLMWNGRFSAPSRDPFDNSQGFLFPAPEGATRFPPFDPIVTHLLVAQAHIPPTELVEVAGFTGTRGTIAPEFDQFDDGLGGSVPLPDASGFRNEQIRRVVLARLNGSPAYRALFGAIFPEVVAGAPIDFTMFGRAIAEFEFTLVFADAPIDRFARGDAGALTTPQKRGGLVFFGKGRCSQCHAVAGSSNEMFSDFQMHVIGVPQIAPFFGVGKGNVIFDGPDRDEDFGLEQITGNPDDRYKFRTSPLRNAALQPAFFHNGAFTRLEDAIRHHLNVFESARGYDPVQAGVDQDLTDRLGPIEPVLERIDLLLATPIDLTPDEFGNLVAFVKDGLLDRRARRQNLCGLAPATVPSGFTTMRFEECPQRATSPNAPESD
ncbi:MAG TPA: cytochrome c peroxidase [Candidatus Polarisedimenticolia bacterium]|nr:cytochrome c peroxidase [Candidatus Polarisedimenticolia bacterium]